MARGLDINADYNDPEDDDDGGGAEYDMRVSDWEDGLPSADDLTPLSQPLIPPELASAFSITPEPSRTLLDVHRASQTTITTLSRQPNPFAAAGNRRIPSFAAEPQHMVGTEEDDEEADGEAYPYGDGGGASGSSSSAAAEAEAEDGSGGALLADMSDLQQQGGAGRGGVGVAKRARLVWTPQLHRRFVEVVAHLGVANAVPKTIMQLMNVEGLTRENVASHLQKYRLYLKRTHGHEDVAAAAGPSTSASFASSAHPRQQQQQQPQQRFAGSTEGSGSESMVRARARAPPPHPSTSYAIPQPVRHGHGGLDLEQPRDWPHGSTSNAAVLAFPHRARVAPK